MRNYIVISSRHPQSIFYGLPKSVLGIDVLLPHSMTPWDGDGTIVKTSLGSGSGTDKKDFLNVYSSAMKIWLEGVFNIGAASLPVVAAKPKQAFASYWQSVSGQVRSAILRGYGIPVPDDVDAMTSPPPKLTLAMYPLPFVSFDRSGVKLRDGQMAVPLRNLSFLLDDRSKTAWSRPPTPYMLGFQIDVWSKTPTMHDWLFAVFDQAFHLRLSQLAIPNPFFDDGEPILGAIRLRDISDTSDTEALETTESLMRWTFSVEVEAWRFYELRAAETASNILISTQDRNYPHDVRPQ